MYLFNMRAEIWLTWSTNSNLTMSSCKNKTVILGFLT
ncbi:rCG42193, partial [Rattus norvegicus]